MIENENDFVCQTHNNQKIISLLKNGDIQVSSRMLCVICVIERGEFSNQMSFERAKTKIIQNQEQLYTTLQGSVLKTQEPLKTFQQKVDNIKQCIIQQFDSLLTNAEQWIEGLAEFQNKKSRYSLVQEIQNVDVDIKYQKHKQQSQLNQLNYSHFQKIENQFSLDFLLKCILNIQKIMEQLHSESVELINLVPQYFLQIQTTDDNPTPYLNLKCSRHRGSVICVDLSKDIKKKERLKCINCQYEQSITIGCYEQQISEYSRNLTYELQKEYIVQQGQLKRIQGDLYDLLMDSAKTISETFKMIHDNYQTHITLNQQPEAYEVEMLNLAELLSQIKNQQKVKIRLALNQKYKKINQDGFQKLQELNKFLKIALENFKRIDNQMVDQSPKQQGFCRAIVFNNSGKIMAATCDEDIRIWEYESGQLEQTSIILQGHQDNIFCLIYSKSKNWIGSAGEDDQIRLWKQIESDKWVSSEPGKAHRRAILCLLMNSNEDQLFSGSRDKTIKIWKINFETNSLTFLYSLEKHKDFVFSISLNESETSLVSCSDDRQILIWGKGDQQIWEYKDTISKSVNDYGYRVCFINDSMIAWQQYSQGYVHIFKLVNGRFIESPELKIQLNEEGYDGNYLFPSIFIKQKKILIWKCKKYVYIFRQENDGKFYLKCEPIYCVSESNFGGITNDGNNLVIWNDKTKEFRSYRLRHQ